MKIYAIVPVKSLDHSKSRLATILNNSERCELSNLLLHNTVVCLEKISEISEILVVASDRRVEQIVKNYNAKFIKEEKDNGVNSAVAIADHYSLEHGADSTLVIPQDLPLLRPNDISIICKEGEIYKKCVLICPSLRFDGTNALLRKPVLSMGTAYDNHSFAMHLRTARDLGAVTKIFLFQSIMIDIDGIDDVKELVNGPYRSNDITIFLRSKLKYKLNII